MTITVIFVFAGEFEAVCCRQSANCRPYQTNRGTSWMCRNFDFFCKHKTWKNFMRKQWDWCNSANGFFYKCNDGVWGKVKRWFRARKVVKYFFLQSCTQMKVSFLTLSQSWVHRHWLYLRDKMSYVEVTIVQTVHYRQFYCNVALW